MIEKFKPEALQTITYSLHLYRLNKDIKYHEKEVERTKLQEVGSTDDIFQKMGKDFTNTFNKAPYESNQKSLDAKLDLRTKLEEKIKEEKIKVIEDLAALATFINELYKDDVADLRSVYIAFNLIFASPYYGTKIKEALRKESFNDVENALLLPKDFFINYEKDLLTKYHLISGKSQSDLLTDATKFGAASGIVAFFTAPLVGLTSYNLGSMAGTGFLVGVLMGTIGYSFKSQENALEVKKAFRQMSVEETDLMLLQKLALIEALNKYRGEKEVDELLQTIIDELINLKSDLDLALFVFRENEKGINADKKESFYRFDKYLLKKLKI